MKRLQNNYNKLLHITFSKLQNNLSTSHFQNYKIPNLSKKLHSYSSLPPEILEEWSFAGLLYEKLFQIEAPNGNINKKEKIEKRKNGFKTFLLIHEYSVVFFMRTITQMNLIK